MSLKTVGNSNGAASISGIIKQIRPLGNRVLVREIDSANATRQIGNIVLPDTAVEKIHQGEVISIGPGLRDSKTGKITPVSVKPGDRVMLPEFGGTSFKYKNSKFGIYHDSDILCVFYDA